MRVCTFQVVMTLFGQLRHKFDCVCCCVQKNCISPSEINPKPKLWLHAVQRLLKSNFQMEMSPFKDAIPISRTKARRVLCIVSSIQNQGEVAAMLTAQ